MEATKLAKRVQAVGLAQVVGGAFGLVAALNLWPHVGEPNAAPAFIAILLGAAGAFSLTAGVALLRGHPAGRRLSLATQGLQWLGVSWGSWSYQLVLGPYVLVTVAFGAGAKVEFGTSAVLLVNAAGGWVPPAVALNVLPCAALLLLIDLPASAATSPAAPSAGVPTPAASMAAPPADSTAI